MAETSHLAKPFRLALRWVAGRDISRHDVDDRALDYLDHVGLIVEVKDEHPDAPRRAKRLILTEAGSAALREIEGTNA